MSVIINDNSLAALELHDKTFPFTMPIIREADQKYLQLLTKNSMVNIIEAIRTHPKEDQKEAKFNGVDLPQPTHIIKSDEVVLNPYSDSPGCRVQVAGVEAAEKVICNGAVTDRFIIIHGIAPGVPTDCYPNRISKDPTFYLVDKYAMERGADCCLVQFWVDVKNDCYTPVAFQHKSGYGHRIVAKLNSLAE